MKFCATVALTALSLLPSAYAQTFSECDPMKRTDCPPNTALGINNYTIDFSKSYMTTSVWNTTAGSVAYNDGESAAYVIDEKGASVTTKTNFYIFWGTLEVIMKAAKGPGIVSSIVMISEDLDEVDWEWIGGNDTHVQSNYFGKGNVSTYDRAVWHPVSDPQNEYHNYTIDWNRDKLDWYIDSQLIRTLKFEQANGGHNYPQTPCLVRLGIWPGGDPDFNEKGVVEWAGGPVDYKKGPYEMNVKSVRVRDGSVGTQYVWGDQTGSYQSIQIRNDTKPIKLDGENGGAFYMSASQRWNKLSNGAKIAIIASIAAVAVVGLAMFGFCCIKQRRAGKHERLVEDAKFEKDRSELMAYRAEMSRQRSEKLAMNGGPVMGIAGATVSYYPPTPTGDFKNYAQSTVSSVGSGRGYQRY